MKPSFKDGDIHPDYMVSPAGLLIFGIVGIEFVVALSFFVAWLLGAL